MSCHIALQNPKSPQNVGSILRAAGCYQAQSIRYSGQRYARASAFNTDTKNQHLNVPIVQVEQLIGENDTGLTKVAIELVEDAVPLTSFNHPENALYLFGPEDGTLDQEVIDQCDHVVYIPTYGCMNLAATVNVVLYDRLSKSNRIPASNELIKNSRDTNNRTKIQKP